MKFKSLLINNLKEIRNFIKDAPEVLRSALGFFLLKINGPVFDKKLNSDCLHFQSGVYSEGRFGKVKKATPDGGHYMTTFFDVSPISPDGKKLCLTKLPFINRIPVPGDLAEICIVNLEDDTIKCVYKTSGWGAQLGANVQWLDDDHVICNTVVHGKGVGVVINVNDTKFRLLCGPVYGITPCKKYSYSGDLSYINALLPGYGIPDPLFGRKRKNKNSLIRDGIWRTDITTGECELFLSMDELLQTLESSSPFRQGVSYIFNTKISDCGRKLFTVVFAKKIPYRIGRAVQLFVVDIETKKVNVAMPDELWQKGGHHPNWVRGSLDVVMNLRYESNMMRFVRFDSNGKNLHVLLENKKGGGHPSISPNGEYLLTDAYVSEGYTSADGTVPIRIIDINDNEEYELCRVYTNKLEGPRRVDPHPVWTEDGRKIILNAMVDGYRQVLIAEFKVDI